MNPVWSARATTVFGAAVFAGVLVACGGNAQSDGPSVAPQARLTTPTDPPKTDPTYAPATSPINGVRWLYLSDSKTLQLQENGNPGLLKEARLRAPDGRIIASGTAHLAAPGEPRQCISNVVSPPLVAALNVGPDVASALRARTPGYLLEVRDDVVWYGVELYDWSNLAGGYCVQ